MLAYDDAVEEALCFGWIDSIIKKMSEGRSIRLRSGQANRMIEAGAGNVVYCSGVEEEILCARQAPIGPPWNHRIIGKKQ